VAIRTAQIAGGELLYGTGGGITFRSEPEAEWEECLAKMAALAELAR
jgi:para-aminobenzoate synthetase component 1